MKKFKNIVKHCCIAFLLVSISSCEKIFLKEPGSDPVSVFEYYWQTIFKDYALFEERNVDWIHQYSRFRPMINDKMSQDSLFKVICEMTLPIDDGHIAIATPNVGNFDGNRIFREQIDNELFDLDLIKNNYLENQVVYNMNKCVYGKIKNYNIAYIHFDVFRQESVKLLDMLDAFPEAKGFIIDLRHNNGGDVSHSFSFLGRFIDSDKFFLRSRTKNGKGSNDFTDWHYWFLRKNGTQIHKPIVILTDRHTVSAAERMVMASKTLPLIHIVGDTTNGTFGTKITKELPNDWYFSYSIQKVEMFDGVSYEGNGLPPDILIKNTLSDLENGIDKVLETALGLF